jgi:uncharacterized protein involved in response to NO
LALIPIQDPRSRLPADHFALFELGFRPFFLLAGIAAVLLPSLWLWLYLGSNAPDLYYGPLLWHGHEMVFGFTLAVVAGFLLTAVRNWTQESTPRGRALLGLALLWLAGRLAPFAAAWLPAWLIALVDLAFLPLLALVLAVPLIRHRQTSNLVFLLILFALAVCNLLVHLELLGLAPLGMGRQAILQAVYIIVLLITIMGGRVIPFFTEKAIPGMQSRSWPLVDHTGLGALLLFILLAPFMPAAAALCALVAGLAHGVRLAGWYHRGIWSRPLLWVLHLGYGWLVTGLLLEALAWQGWLAASLALHALTLGGIGMITLGMMARVALGHTGRKLEIRPSVVWAFGLLALATGVRVLLPLVAIAGAYPYWVLFAGILWVGAFILFILAYWPVLLRPRIDGMPG